MRVVLTFSAEWVTTSLIPSSPSRASSILRLTPSSTSSGSAPGKGTVIKIMSNENSGKFSRVMEQVVRPPAVNMSTSMMLAKTVLRAKDARKCFIGNLPMETH